MDSLNPRVPAGLQKTMYEGDDHGEPILVLCIARASSRVPIRKCNSATSSPTGRVRADTLVWSEGMAGWQKAAEIPGLIGRRLCARR